MASGAKQADPSMISNRVIVIGAGLAGIVAAIRAEQEGAEVILMDRGPIGTGTNSCLANAYFAGPVAGYSADAYSSDVLQAGRFLNHRSVVDFLAQEAPAAFQFLRSLGLSITEAPMGLNVNSALPGVIPGVTLMRTLATLLHKVSGIHVRKGFYVTEIVTAENRVLGVRGIDRDGNIKFYAASAVVLATGGAGAIYLRNDNQKRILGQGYYLAAMAGLALWDMEFVQFYPLVLAEPGYPSLILFPPYPREVRLINETGEEVLPKSNLGSINSAIMKKRDAFSTFLYQEAKDSRIYLDLRRVPEALWNDHPFTLLKNLKFDFRSKPITVSPAAHFFMGGIKADERGQSEVSGLFACGEILWGLHGANRMGGNALTECIVTGCRAGKWAGRHGQTASAPSVLPERDCIPAAFGEVQADMAQALKKMLGGIKAIAESYSGVVRSKAGLQEGIRLAAEMKQQLKTFACKGRAANILLQDSRSACFVLEAILTASLGREESRGAFIRSDFPNEDDHSWKKNSCLRYDKSEDRFILEHVPVP